MFCARCRHHTAVPGGTLCTGCATAPAAPAAPPFTGAPAVPLRSPVGLGRAAVAMLALVVLRLTRMQHEEALRGPVPAAA